MIPTADNLPGLVPSVDPACILKLIVTQGHAVAHAVGCRRVLLLHTMVGLPTTMVTQLWWAPVVQRFQMQRRHRILSIAYRPTMLMCHTVFVEVAKGRFPPLELGSPVGRTRTAVLGSTMEVLMFRVMGPILGTTIRATLRIGQGLPNLLRQWLGLHITWALMGLACTGFLCSHIHTTLGIRVIINPCGGLTQALL